MQKLSINWDVFATKMARLQERGLIINNVDLNPSREKILEWITTNFIQDLGAKVT